MTYIDHIYICMAAPMLIGMLFVKRRGRTNFLFIIAGMTSCFLSAYINSFFSVVYGADISTATAEITPVVEEIMKLLPLMFYLLVFEPENERAQSAAIIIAVSFATFENVCWLTDNGAKQLNFLLLRGFSTGAMHVVCGAVVSAGLVYIWHSGWLKVAGTAGLLCSAVTFHAMYNLLLTAGGKAQVVGYIMPIGAALIGFLLIKLLHLRISKQNN
jgi:RsiW-degrading membrane proteinase PrsW (M82 family)